MTDDEKDELYKAAKEEADLIWMTVHSYEEAQSRVRVIVEAFNRIVAPQSFEVIEN